MIFFFLFSLFSPEDSWCLEWEPVLSFSYLSLPPVPCLRLFCSTFWDVSSKVSFRLSTKFHIPALMLLISQNSLLLSDFLRMAPASHLWAHCFLLSDHVGALRRDPLHSFGFLPVACPFCTELSGLCLPGFLEGLCSWLSNLALERGTKELIGSSEITGWG